MGVDWDLLTIQVTKQTICPNLEGHWLAVLFSRQVAKFKYFDFSRLEKFTSIEKRRDPCTFIFQAKYFVYSWCDIENTVYCYTFEDIKTGCIMLDEFYSILL